jgi:ribosomal protein S18 acetylase RimI-like enzyme
VPITYRYDCDGITQEKLEAIFVATDLDGRQDGNILKAFRQSTDACFAFDGEKLIGTSRALSDGVYHAFIYDVAVLPAYQGQGIGSEMVRQLIARNPVWRTMLRADADVQPFYDRLGFELYSDVMAYIDVSRIPVREQT